MLEKGFLKPELSISTLSKKRFWVGVMIGLLSSFVLSYFFNYTRESLRGITFMHDPLILSAKDFRYYDMFFAGLATSLGFGVATVYWLIGRNSKIKKRYFQIYAIANTLFVAFFVLVGITRFGTVLLMMLYSVAGYDNHFDMLNEYWLLLILLPVYVFFFNWIVIRLLFKSSKWMLISILLYFVISFYLFKTTTVDRSIFNQAYYTEYKDEFDYIDEEFQKAKKYGIYFTKSTKQILRKQSSESTIELVNKLKVAFSKGNIVSLDTLILEKIAVHNMKSHSHVCYFRHHGLEKLDNNWSYAMPEEIYYQILQHDINSTETRLLFEILYEQILLFTNFEMNRGAPDYFRKYSNYEISRDQFRRRLYRNTWSIQSRLVQVVDKLRGDSRFDKYHHLLPSLKFTNERGRQKYYKLELTSANTSV